MVDSREISRICNVMTRCSCVSWARIYFGEKVRTCPVNFGFQLHLDISAYSLLFVINLHDSLVSKEKLK